MVCPKCGHRKLIKYGTKRVKCPSGADQIRKVQRYQCAKCLWVGVDKSVACVP